MDLQTPAHPIRWPAALQMGLLAAEANGEANLWADPWGHSLYRRYGAGWGKSQCARARRWKSWTRRRLAAGLSLRLERARWLGPSNRPKAPRPQRLTASLGVDLKKVAWCVRHHQAVFGQNPTVVYLPRDQCDFWRSAVGPFLRVCPLPQLDMTVAEAVEIPEGWGVPVVTLRVGLAKPGKNEPSVG